MRKFSSVFVAAIATVLFFGCFLSTQTAFAGGTTLYVYYYGNGSTSGSMVGDSYNSSGYISVRSNWFKRDGYTFECWNTNAAGTGANFSPGQILSCMNQNLNLFAKWKQTSPAKISVTYNPNGCAGSVITDSVNCGAAYSIRQNPFSRPGYSFAGWTTNSNGTGTFYSAGQVVCFSNSVTLYAKWTAVICQVQVTYCPNGASGSNFVDYPNAGAAYSIRQNPFSKPGNSFAGWTTNANGTGTLYSPGQVVCFSSSVTLYAKWTGCQYVVSYYPNGASGSGVFDYINSGAYYSIRSNPFVKNGANFVGWNTNPNGTGTYYSPSQTICITGPLVLYAMWNSCSLTITYCPNGGLGSSIIENVNPGSSHRLLGSIYVRVGYTFDGWNTRPDGLGIHYTTGQTVCLTGSITLYAKWRKC